jgi:hypothetical protein
MEKAFKLTYIYGYSGMLGKFGHSSSGLLKLSTRLESEMEIT